MAADIGVTMRVAEEQNVARSIGNHRGARPRMSGHTRRRKLRVRKRHPRRPIARGQLRDVHVVVKGVHLSLGVHTRGAAVARIRDRKAPIRCERDRGELRILA